MNGDDSHATERRPVRRLRPRTTRCGGSRLTTARSVSSQVLPGTARQRQVRRVERPAPGAVDVARAGPYPFGLCPLHDGLEPAFVESQDLLGGLDDDAELVVVLAARNAGACAVEPTSTSRMVVVGSSGRVSRSVTASDPLVRSRAPARRRRIRAPGAAARWRRTVRALPIRARTRGVRGLACGRGCAGGGGRGCGARCTRGRR